MSIEYYHGLLADRARIEAFERAIRERVGPGDRVLEIGTGLGTYAFFAVRAGARRVWAVDSAPIVHVAEAVAVQNELSDRIDFVRGTVPDIELPEPVDVLIFEDFSTRLLDANTYRMLRAAYGRYLGPGGVVVPGHAELFMAPVSAPRSWTQLYPFSREHRNAFGLDWSPSIPYLENTPQQVGLAPEDLAGGPVRLSRVDLCPLPDPRDLGGRGSWVMDVDTTIRGLAFWFALELTPGVRVSNRPGPGSGPWGQVLLPLPTPLEVPAGATLSAQIESRRLADGAPGWFSWSAQCGSERTSGHEFASEPAGLADMFAEGEPAVSDEPRLSVPEELKLD